MQPLQLVAPTRGPQKQTQTRVDTILVTPEIIKSWIIPPFQRPLRVNAKVLELSETLKADDGVFPGILTIGAIAGKTFLVDGQHRVEAFKISELTEGYTDVRYRHYESMAEMAEDFVRLNSQLVRMRPDDILRGLEGTSESLKLIRLQCPFVGYDNIRRGSRAPVISMSMVLRSWFGAGKPTPAVGGISASDMARAVTLDDAAPMIEFLQLAERAWGRDVEYHRLWSILNVCICMWIYRNTVLRAWSSKSPKLSKDIFRKCMLSLSASPEYTEWLTGRNLNDRDRSPCYKKIKGAFVRTLEREFNRKVSFPSPEWTSD